MLRGKKRSVIACGPKRLGLSASLHNRFDIEVVDSITGKVKQIAQAENVICSNLWTRIVVNTYFNYLFYGTGSGTPSSTDTSLFAHLGYGAPSTSDDVYSYDLEERVISLRRKIQLSETTAVGSTLTEVGIGYGTSSSNLVTHAMLKDMNGNSISIAKTATDIINIYATVFFHWSTYGNDRIVVTVGGHGGNINVEFPSLYQVLLGMAGYGSIYAFLSNQNFPARNNVYTSTAGAIEYVNRSSPMTVSWNSSTKTATLTMNRIPVSSVNIGGIKSIGIGKQYNLGGAFNFYCDLILYPDSSWCPGSTITAEAIGTGDGSAIDFATDFPLVSSPTIYVDGVEQTSGVSVDLGVPLTTNIGQYFEFLPQYSEWITATGLVGHQNPCVSSANIDRGQSMSVWHNPHYALGVDTFYASNTTVKVAVSNDLETWADLTVAYGTNNVPSEYKNYKYWRMGTPGADVSAFAFNFCNTSILTSNIHFTTAPTNGAVITADYTTGTIAKDSDHVFDLSIEITLAEKTV